jgi:hypothetical protein
VSGCSPMGRQPDDPGTPALAWLACRGGSRPARSPGDGEGELGRAAVALPVVVDRVVGQRAARPRRRSRYHRNPGTRLDVSWQRLQTCPQPSCRGQVPRLRVPNRLRVHVRDGLPFAFTARARIASPLCCWCQVAGRVFFEVGFDGEGVPAVVPGRMVVSGPGVAGPKSRRSGCEPAALESEPFPGCPPGPSALACRASARRRAKMASLTLRLRDLSASLWVFPSATFLS